MDETTKMKLENIKNFLEDKYNEEVAVLHEAHRSAVIFFTVVAFVVGVFVGYVFCTLAK